jgi:hypothetical protein
MLELKAEKHICKIEYKFDFRMLFVVVFYKLFLLMNGKPV